MEAAIAEQ